MAPRKYTLGKRAVAVAETRSRIVAAATEAYTERGIVGTSMQEVARRADVAAGTVLYHFPTTDDLAREVIEQLKKDLRMPTEEIFVGASTLGERLGRYVHGMFGLLERSEEWYRIYAREKDQVDALVSAEVEFWQDMMTLIAMALGPRAGDQRAVAVVSALTDPSVLDSLRQRGFSTSEASDIVAEMLRGWFEVSSHTEE